MPALLVNNDGVKGDALGIGFGEVSRLDNRAGAGAHRPRVNRAAIREEVSGILAEQAETELGDAIRDAIDAIELGTYTEQEQGGGAAARRGSAGTHSGDDADARHGDDEDDDNDNDSEEEHWDNLFKL